jgi:hypothetical protein
VVFVLAVSRGSSGCGGGRLQAQRVAHRFHREGLGAVPLLWHGIWAFKVSAKGITDLVFNEPFEDLEQRGVEALVLTEWKLAGEKNANDRFEEAHQQAERYTEGALGGSELRGFR